MPSPIYANQPSSPSLGAGQPLPAMQRLLLANSGTSQLGPGFNPADYEAALPTGGDVGAYVPPASSGGPYGSPIGNFGADFGGRPGEPQVIIPTAQNPSGVPAGSYGVPLQNFQDYLTGNDQNPNLYGAPPVTVYPSLDAYGNPISGDWAGNARGTTNWAGNARSGYQPWQAAANAAATSLGFGAGSIPGIGALSDIGAGWQAVGDLSGLSGGNRWGGRAGPDII